MPLKAITAGAHQFLSSEKPRFCDIEDAVGLSMYRPLLQNGKS